MEKLQRKIPVRGCGGMEVDERGRVSEKKGSYTGGDRSGRGTTIGLSYKIHTHTHTCTRASASTTAAAAATSSTRTTHRALRIGEGERKKKKRDPGKSVGKRLKNELPCLFPLTLSRSRGDSERPRPPPSSVPFLRV